MTVRLAILGAGRIGQTHAKAIAGVPHARLVAVSDPVAESAEKVAEAYSCSVMDIDAIRDARDIDGVVICTPTDTHAQLIEIFVRAGKAVFCEKPIDLDLSRVRACLQVVEKSGMPLMVGFQRRFDPDFCALKAAIDGGKVGTVEMVTLTSRDPGPPPLEYIARSGGIFKDMTIHDFDVARWLLDEEVTHVFAAGSVLTDRAIGEAGDYDSVNVVLKTVSGKQATITNTRRASYGYDQRIEVHGSKGAVSAQNNHQANIEIADSEGYHRPPLLDFFMTRYAAAYAAEIAVFVSAVKNGTRTPTTGNDGLMSLALAEAAMRSAKTGKSVAVADILAGSHAGAPSSA